MFASSGGAITNCATGVTDLRQQFMATSGHTSAAYGISCVTWCDRIDHRGSSSALEAWFLMADLQWKEVLILSYQKHINECVYEILEYI